MYVNFASPTMSQQTQIMEQKQSSPVVEAVVDVVIGNKTNKKQFLETSFQFSSHAANNYGEEAGGDDEEGEDYDDLEAELLGEGGGGSHSGNLIISENTMNKRINLRLFYLLIVYNAHNLLVFSLTVFELKMR